MNKIFNWLTAHKTTNLIIAIIYYLLIVLPHEQVGRAIVALFKTKSRAYYQHTVLLIGVVALCAVVLFLALKIKNHPYRNRLLIGLATTIAMMVVSFNLLLVHNVEIIHFVQYASFCFVVFPLFGNYNKTLFWCTLAGAIDEANQYLILAPKNTDYYDFNDVILNQLGAGMGLVILFAFGFYSVRNIQKKWYLSSEIIASVAVVVSLIAMYLAGEFSYYIPAQGDAPFFVLIKKVYPDFFTEIKHLNVRFHVLSPYAGFIIVALIGMFYSLVLRNTKKELNA